MVTSIEVHIIHFEFRFMSDEAPACFWVFTLNNPDALLDFSECKWVRYAIYSEEIGANGTNHFQGYIELRSNRRLSFLQKLIPGAHFEKRRGTQLEAIRYSSKTEDDSFIAGPYEYGSPSKGQGNRSDLLLLKQDLDEGKSLREISNAHFSLFLRHNRSIQSYLVLNSKQVARQPPLVSYYFGFTGTGKSFSCASSYPEAFWLSANNWWDGYSGERVVILDDFSGWLPYHFLLRLLDRYPFTVETKGATRILEANRIILTSNFLPHQLYTKIPDIEPFLRRISNFVFFWDTHLVGCPIKCKSYTEFIEEIGESARVMQQNSRSVYDRVEVVQERDVDNNSFM